MIKSMTGYGRADHSTDHGTVMIEAKSVNHRYLDTSLRIPSKLSRLEPKIKKKIESFISRGRLEMFISFTPSGESEQLFEVNLPVAKGYVSALGLLKEALGLEGEITLTDVAAVKDVVTPKDLAVDEDILWKTVLSPLGSALSSLCEMRENEGASLVLDIRERLESIVEIADTILAGQPDILRQHHEKMKKRLYELDGKIKFDDDRIAQEIALIADKSDITEEVVRLKSHARQFSELLQKEGPVGRKLDFLVQEMNREVNTIGSKSCSAETSKMVVEMKSEIERIREQVQNIE